MTAQVRCVLCCAMSGRHYTSRDLSRGWKSRRAKKTCVRSARRGCEYRVSTSRVGWRYMYESL